VSRPKHAIVHPYARRATRNVRGSEQKSASRAAFVVAFASCAGSAVRSAPLLVGTRAVVELLLQLSAAMADEVDTLAALPAPSVPEAELLGSPSVRCS